MIVGSAAERLAVIATEWREAIARVAYIPYPPREVRQRFEQMTAGAVDVLRDGDESEIEQYGRFIGRELIELNLMKAEALQGTVSCLGHALEGVTTSGRLTLFLAGISGEFVACFQTGLLDQQESMRRAAMDALSRLQRDLERSQQELTQINRELSFNINERIKAEEVQREYARRLQRLRKIDLSILSAESLSAVVDISLEYLKHIVSANVITIALINNKLGQLIIQKSTSHLYPAGREFSIDMTHSLHRLEKGQIYVNPDLSIMRDQSADTAEIVDLGARSLMAVPLHYHNETIGCVVVTLAEVRDFSEREIEGVQEIADSISIAIQNRRLLEAEQEAHHRESILRDVAANLTLDLTPSELSKQLLAKLEMVIPFRSAAILLLEQGGLSVAARYGQTTESSQLESLLANHPRSMWTVIEEKRPLIINDVDAAPNWIIIKGYEYVRSWMGVPLLVKGECIGLLVIDRDQVNTFHEHERDLAEAFANQAAIVIDNGRLFEQQQIYAEQLTRQYHERELGFDLLYGITEAAVSRTDRESLLDRSLDLVLEAFDGLTAAIFLPEGKERKLALTASVDREPSVVAILHDLVIGNPALWPQSANSFHILTGSDLPVELPGYDDSALVILPLRSRDVNLGLFCMVNRSARGFSEEAVGLLRTVVDQIAVAIENIRLRQLARQTAIIEERERLSREIHDSVTQSIYSIGLFAGAAQGSITAGNTNKAQQNIQSILGMTDLALRDLRLLLFELRTESLARLGLVGALRERFSLVERRMEIQAEVHAAADIVLPMPIEEAFYRVTLEALNNSLRHAHASRIIVTLSVNEDDYSVVVSDDGVGFDEVMIAGEGGMGLEGMEARLEKLGGTLNLLTQVGVGTTVTAQVPRQHVIR